MGARGVLGGWTLQGGGAAYASLPALHTQLDAAQPPTHPNCRSARTSPIRLFILKFGALKPTTWLQHGMTGGMAGGMAGRAGLKEAASHMAPRPATLLRSGHRMLAGGPPAAAHSAGTPHLSASQLRWPPISSAHSA